MSVMMIYSFSLMGMNTQFDYPLFYYYYYFFLLKALPSGQRAPPPPPRVRRVPHLTPLIIRYRAPHAFCIQVMHGPKALQNLEIIRSFIIFRNLAERNTIG